MACVMPVVEPQFTTSSNGHKRGKLRLLSRDKLDRRTLAARQFDAIASGIAADLGGEDHLTTVERHLIEGFAGAALRMHDVNARVLLGQEIDLAEHASIISSLVRIASRLGTQRRPRDLAAPSLTSYLDHGAPGE
jgi:hypothetical protein